MRDDQIDYELFVRWRNEPHVAEWWNTDEDPSPMTLEHAQAEYGPDADAWVSAVHHLRSATGPVGYVQFYPWSAEPDEAREMGVPDPDASYGLDIFIGEPDMIGRGRGCARVVAMVSRHLFETEGADAAWPCSRPSATSGHTGHTRRPGSGRCGRRSTPTWWTASDG